MKRHIFSVQAIKKAAKRSLLISKTVSLIAANVIARATTRTQTSTAEISRINHYNAAKN
jgi:hypothetical protein